MYQLKNNTVYGENVHFYALINKLLNNTVPTARTHSNEQDERMIMHSEFETNVN
jgi:hypothetical protein